MIEQARAQKSIIKCKAADRDKQRELDLILRIVVQRDQTALKTVYQSYAQRLRHLARRYLADASHADDIVHDSMMQLWLLEYKAGLPKHLFGWLCAVVKFKAIDINRAGKRRRRLQDQIDLPMACLGPNEKLEASQLSEFLARQMALLSRNSARVLRLFYYEGLGCSEIARLENCPKGTVKSRLYNARLELRSCVEPLKFDFLPTDTAR